MSKQPAGTQPWIISIIVMQTIGALLILVADVMDRRKRAKCRALQGAEPVVRDIHLHEL